MRDGINNLEKVVLYLESQIKFLESPRIFSDSSKKYSIFISHINENKEIAEILKDFFVKNFQGKVDVFISSDPDTISVSQDWFERIKNGIKNCDPMIILCTRTLLNVRGLILNRECGNS